MMSERLDDLIERLAAAPIDRRLDCLDSDVSRAVMLWQARARATRALAPVRVASIGLALAVGVAVGGVTAAASVSAPRGPNGFPPTADLAPSSLLEGGR
jgi:hypothetical protein